MDFYNMLERERLESKKTSKTNAVTSIMGHTLPADDVHVGPSDYVPWLTDRKWAHIRLEGQAFGDVPLNIELKLEVWDSPNSAGIVIDAVRCCKLAPRQRPVRPTRRPQLVPDEVAHEPAPGRRGAEATEKFIAKYARQATATKTAKSKAELELELKLPLVPGERLAIAQVTPFAWEVAHEVNDYVARVSGELARRGHRVLIVAPSQNGALVRDSRRAIRGETGRCSTRSDGEPLVLGVGEVLPFSPTRRRAASLPLDVARTIEEALVNLPLDIVHIHEPFAPSASSVALRHSRGLNVGSFHAPTERILSTQLTRPLSRLLFGRLDARTASYQATRELIQRYFPGDYRVILPGAEVESPATAAARNRAAPVQRRRGAGRAAPVPAGAARAAGRARVARHRMVAAAPRPAGHPEPCPARTARVRGRRPDARGPGAVPGRRARAGFRGAAAGAGDAGTRAGGRRPADRLAAGRLRGTAGPGGVRVRVRARGRADAGRPPYARDRGAGAARAGAGPASELSARFSWTRVADELEDVYGGLVARRHDTRANGTIRTRLRERRMIDVDLHMHTDHSYDCATPVEVLLAEARSRGLGAIAITDHNEISGAHARRPRRTGSR